jgi:hypothetical protein
MPYENTVHCFTFGVLQCLYDIRMVRTPEVWFNEVVSVYCFYTGRVQDRAIQMESHPGFFSADSSGVPGVQKIKKTA